jgi:S-adenosylmethionine decarboxylase
LHWASDFSAAHLSAALDGMDILMGAPELLPSPQVKARGIHLLGEWYGCDFSAPALHDAKTLRVVCLFVTKNSGLQIVGDAFHQFEPEGVIGTVLHTESHLSIHTWPETKFVTIDVYMCNCLEDNTRKAPKLYSALRAYFQPVRENFSQVPRGNQHE